MIFPTLALSILGYGFTLVSSGGDYIDLTEEPWLDPASITVTVNGDTVSARLSARGPTSGLVIDPPALPGDTVTIAADTLGISLPKIYKLEVQPLETGEACVMPSFRFGADPVPEGLFISGSKKLGVSVGSGGGISQGTELSIQGLLAPGITIDGRISDRDLPLGASSSEALSELDKVYVELSGGSWNAEMGDLEWEGTGPVPWRSEVAGFHAGMKPFENLETSGGYGTTSADRRRTVFLTEEGVQGPYSFAEDGGVTPGSERLFLDGERLQRGSGADYEIDYAGGFVTFSTGRLIRRDQRVEISYYRQGDGFRKSVATGETAFELGAGLVLGVNGFTRGDDTGAPLGFVMTDEIEEVLANAGEDPSEAWIDGGRYVGEGNGSYSLDSLSRYSWEGPGLGDWTVEFQKPPDGPGDYVYDSGAGGYLWAGEGLGTHLPRRYLTIPSSSDIAGVTLSGSLGAMEVLSLHSTFSSKTGNLFNDDATTREGTLSGGEIAVRPWESGPLMSVAGRYVSIGFNPPDDMDQGSDLLKWGLPLTWNGRDSFGEASVTGDAFSVSAGRRFLESGGTSEIVGAELTGASGRLEMSLFSRALFRGGSSLMTDGRRGEFGGGISMTAGNLTPFLEPSYTAESWGDSLSGGLLQATAGILHESGGWKSSVSAGGELDRRTGTAYPGRTLRLDLSTRGSGPSWNTGGSVQHSTGWYEGGGSTSSEAVNLSYSGRRGGMWFHGRYSAGGYIAREMDIVYTWVGAGNGDYGYDPDTGEYYPDPSGEYIQSYVPGQGDTRILEADLNGGFSWSDSTETAGIDGSFGLSASDPDDRFSTYALAGAFDTASPGEWNGSLSPFLAWEDGSIRRLTLKVSGYDRREDYSGAGVTREFYRRLEILPVLRPLELLEVQLRGFTALKRKSLYGPRETSENGASIDPVLLFPWGLDAGLKLSVENRREKDGEPDVTGLGLEPHTTLNSGGWTVSGRFAAWFLPDGDVLPTWFFDGKQRGWTLEPTLSVGRNLSRWFSVSLFYWGRKQPESSWEQRGGIEGTVNF